MGSWVVKIMLSFMRTYATGWIIKIMLGSIIVVFIFWGAGSFKSKNKKGVKFLLNAL